MNPNKSQNECSTLFSRVYTLHIACINFNCIRKKLYIHIVAIRYILESNALGESPVIYVATIVFNNVVTDNSVCQEM